MNWLKLKIMAASVLLLFLFSCQKNDVVTVSRHFYLVVDTSGSMAGPNGTMEKIKRNIQRLVSSFKNGDMVSIYTFSDDTRLEMTWEIQSDADRQELESFVKNLNPAGRYTDMKRLLDTLKEKLETTSQEEERKKAQFVIVLTDGVDDPNPVRRKESEGLEKYRETGPIEESYVYYINLGKLRDPVLEKGLKDISNQVKVIEKKPTEKATAVAKVQSLGKETGKTGGAAMTGQKAQTRKSEKPESVAKVIKKETQEAKEKPGNSNSSSSTEQKTAVSKDGGSVDGIAEKQSDDSVVQDEPVDEIGLGEVTSDIETISMNRSVPDLILRIVIAFLVIGVLLWAILALIFKKIQGRILGVLSVRDFGSPAYSARQIRLDRFKTGRLTIGSGSGNHIKLKDLGLESKVVLGGKSVNGKLVLVPKGKSSNSVKIGSGKKIIESGDEFTIGNYIFEYGHGQKR